MSPLLDVLNWAFLFMTLSGMALMLRALGRRLGEALHMKKYYFLYDVSVAIIAASTAIMFLGDDRWSLPGGLLFLLGAALMVGATIRYWGWIIPEIFKPGE